MNLPAACSRLIAALLVFDNLGGPTGRSRPGNSSRPGCRCGPTSIGGRFTTPTRSARGAALGLPAPAATA